MAPMPGTLVVLPRASRRRGHPRRRHARARGRRRPPRRARVRDARRSRRGRRRRARSRRGARRPARATKPRGAAEVLGVARVEFLGYRDSGMAGDADQRRRRRRSGPPTSRRRRAQLAGDPREEDAEVLTVYDERGGYGHPDHIQVHASGVRAAELAGTPRVLRGDGEPRALPRAWRRNAIADGARRRSSAPTPRRSTSASTSRRSPPSSTSSSVIDRKRAAMAAHPSQIGDESFFLALDDDAFLRTCSAPSGSSASTRPRRAPRPGSSTSSSRSSDRLRSPPKVAPPVAERPVRRPRRVRRHHEPGEADEHAGRSSPASR